MTESGQAASFGIDIIIMASAGGVEFAVGAAAGVSVGNPGENMAALEEMMAFARVRCIGEAA